MVTLPTLRSKVAHATVAVVEWMGADEVEAVVDGAKHDLRLVAVSRLGLLRHDLIQTLVGRMNERESFHLFRAIILTLILRYLLVR